jgi:hypothetical protein
VLMMFEAVEQAKAAARRTDGRARDGRSKKAVAAE